MNKKDLLLRLIGIIGELSGLPPCEEEANSTNKNRYLHLEYAAIYGGYRLVLVGTESRVHYGVFGGNGCEPRLSANEMEIKLRGIIAGLEYSKKIP